MILPFVKNINTNHSRCIAALNEFYKSIIRKKQNVELPNQGSVILTVSLLQWSRREKGKPTHWRALLNLWVTLVLTCVYLPYTHVMWGAVGNNILFTFWHHASFPVDLGVLIVGSVAVSSAVKQNLTLPSLSPSSFILLYFSVHSISQSP